MPGCVNIYTALGSVASPANTTERTLNGIPRILGTEQMGHWECKHPPSHLQHPSNSDAHLNSSLYSGGNSSPKRFKEWPAQDALWAGKIQVHLFPSSLQALSSPTSTKWRKQSEHSAYPASSCQAAGGNEPPAPGQRRRWWTGTADHHPTPTDDRRSYIQTGQLSKHNQTPFSKLKITHHLDIFRAPNATARSVIPLQRERRAFQVKVWLVSHPPPLSLWEKYIPNSPPGNPTITMWWVSKSGAQEPGKDVEHHCAEQDKTETALRVK